MVSPSSGTLLWRLLPCLGRYLGVGQAVGVMAGTGRGDRGARREDPRAGAPGSGHPWRGVQGIVCRALPPCAVFWGFRVINQPPTLMVTEPWSIQVAWSLLMLWCRALLMVPHILRWVASSGVGHLGSMRGILAFARAELMMFGGGTGCRGHQWHCSPRVPRLDGALASHGGVGARTGPAARWGLAGPRIVPRCKPCMLCLRCPPAVCTWTSVLCRR